MVKIRLARYGAKKKPFYKIVATDERLKRSGKPLEVLGYWNPLKKDLKIDKEKLDSWIKRGAKLTNAVSELLK